MNKKSQQIAFYKLIKGSKYKLYVFIKNGILDEVLEDN